MKGRTKEGVSGEFCKKEEALHPYFNPDETL
jgi:hypothetical protein